ncbi:ermin isoform X2 [Octodon degus]|uniref:Ermin n=1 Tax=Octodon degus TaxID=10160 RepID=A0A6P3VAY0_OCTDE|nr:ermin isoform X2 [Octodon degus]
MTEVPATLSGAECNGESPPEHAQNPVIEISGDMTDVACRAEPHPEDLPHKGSQGAGGTPQGGTLLSLSLDGKILKGIETSADKMTFREGHEWEKIPSSSTSNQELRSPPERKTELLLEETGEDSKTEAHWATETECLEFQRPSHTVVLHSKQEEEEEVWDEETNDVDSCIDDEDEVRVIEFKKKHEVDPEFQGGGDVSEDSPLSSPSSQPVTPDEPPALGKKGDISRNTYSRYNTISYRKIRKGNTKQRIDEFESMMHL